MKKSFKKLFEQTANYFETPLTKAVWDCDYDVVKQLIDDGANPEEINGGGSSPLHLAIEQSDVKIVELLLGAGATPDREDVDGWTPLIRAIEVEVDAASQDETKQPSTSIVALLLQFGANPNLVATKWPYTPLNAAQTLNFDDAQALLIRHGAKTKEK